MIINQYNLFKKILHSKSIYCVSKLFITLKKKGFMKKALLYSLKETRDAYISDKRPTIWCSTFVPSELVYALGGVPFMPEVAAGFSSTIKKANELIIESEGKWIDPDLCSVHRCGIGLTNKELLPKPDSIIASSHLCDGAKKYLQYISFKYNCPYYLLETPYNLENTKYLARQIKKLVNEFNTNVEFTNVFNNSNQARTYLQEINHLRKCKPAPISGEKILNMIPMKFMSFGTKKGVKYYKSLLQELKDRVNKNRGPVKQEKYRILWLHLKPYYNNNIFSTLRSNKAVTAFEEYSQANWQELDKNKPFQSLASKMINHFGWGTIRSHFNDLEKIVEEYNIDGVIGFSQWGCRQNNGRMGKFKKLFKNKGIPFLNIEGDLIDNRNYREGQLKVRLQAFLELIESKQGDNS